MQLKPNNVEAYIELFPTDTKEKLYNMRRIIQLAAPLAVECISYGMPAYTYCGPLVYFAGYKKHIGFYPIPSGIVAFKDKLTRYKTSKGAIQFPLSENLPIHLIEEIILFRINENRNKR